MKSHSTLSPSGAEAGGHPVDSRAPTVVPSENPSTAHLETEKEKAPSTSSQEKKELGSSSSAVEEPAKTPEENKEDEPDYVTGLPLLIIIVGLCLAVLLVALVCF